MRNFILIGILNLFGAGANEFKNFIVENLHESIRLLHLMCISHNGKVHQLSMCEHRYRQSNISNRRHKGRYSQTLSKSIIIILLISWHISICHRNLLAHNSVHYFAKSKRKTIHNVYQMFGARDFVASFQLVEGGLVLKAVLLNVTAYWDAII